MRRLVLAVLAVLVAAGLGQHWELELVDSLAPGRVPRTITIRSLPDGRPCICYGAVDGTTVRFAVRDSVWRIEDVAETFQWPRPTMDVGRDGSVAVCYEDTGALRYATRRDSGWQIERLPFDGEWPVVALDPGGTPYILFLTPPSVDLAVKTDSGWTVDSVFHAPCSGWYDFSYGPVVFPDSAPPAVFVGRSFDNMGRTSGTTMSLRQASGDSWRELWRYERGDSSLSRAHGVVSDTDGSLVTCYWTYHPSEGSRLVCGEDVVGLWYAWYAALRLDALARPHVAYSFGSLGYSWKSGGGWLHFQVPGVEGVGGCDLLLGEDGQPMIAFQIPEGGVWVARGVNIVGAEEEVASEPPGFEPNRTIYRTPELTRLDCRVLDIQGRDVTNRRERLAPGIYFLRPAYGRESLVARKVVVQR